MSMKEELGKFIDAVATNNEADMKELFSAIASNSMSNILNPERSVMESIMSVLNERVDMGDGFYYEGSSIYFNGKPIGTIEYTSVDETGEENSMWFVGRDGYSMSIPNNDFYELSEYVKNKYLKGYKK